MTVGLSLDALDRALASLEAALTLAGDVPDDIVRDACIQRFEYTYELSHKMLKRYLEATSANPAEVDTMSFQDLIRTGSERGLLLGDWTSWRSFRAARGATSHTYDESKAVEVFRQLPSFAKEARYLRNRLHELNA